MRCTDSFLPLNEKAEVRAATRRPGVRASALRISSVMPSLKYSLSLAALMFSNGSTAMDFWSEAGAVPGELATCFAEPLIPPVARSFMILGQAIFGVQQQVGI